MAWTQLRQRRFGQRRAGAPKSGARVVQRESRPAPSNLMGMPSMRSRGWLPVAGLGLLFALVPSRLAATGAQGVQVVAAAAGALMATGGAALVRLGWPRRRHSDLYRLIAAPGFFLLCAGAVAMLVGVGLYH